MISASVDTSALQRRLSSLRRDEIPSAMRNTLNDLAFDMRERLVTEIGRIFDRPTPVVRKTPRVERASKQKLEAKLYLTDYFRQKGQDPANALRAHMTGLPPTRNRKGLEMWLQRRGLISSDEWMMPTRFVPKDRYGNVRGSLVQKMLADLNAYGGYSVATRATGARKRQYFWIGGAYGLPNGIYVKRGTTSVAMFVAVSTTPTYGKRFRWKELSSTYTKQRLNYHADRAIAQAIRKRNT